METLEIYDGLKSMVARETSGIYEWQFELIKPYLGRRILELGPGDGYFSRRLQGEKLVLIEKYRSHVDSLKKTFGSDDKIEIVNDDILKVDIDLLSEYDFDTILSMNVLEHIEDDMRVFHIFYQILKSPGKIILILPAHSFLYCGVDQVSGHFRRYDKSKLVSNLENGGFKIVKCNHIMRIGALVYYYKGKIRKSNELFFHRNNKAGFIRHFLPFMKLFDKLVPLNFGLSILCVAEK